VTAPLLPSGGRARMRRLASLTVTSVLSIVYLWLGTTPNPPGVFAHLADATSHSVGYGLLAVASRATAVTWGLPAPALVAFSYALAHGGLLELAQGLGEARRAEWRDLAWDGVGVVAALALVEGVRRVRCAC